MSKTPEDVKLSLNVNGITIDGLNLLDPNLDIKVLENKIADAEGMDALAEAMTNATIADCYHHGKKGMKIDIKKAYHHYCLAAKAGLRPAQHNVASLIWEFIFINDGSKPTLNIQNPVETFLKFLTMAATGKDGLPKSKYLLAKAYCGGRFGIAKNAPLCVKYLKEAAENYPAAYFTLGLCYETGFGITKDLEQAFLTYQKGVALNNSDCITAIALFYEQGKGKVSQDLKKAKELLEQAIQLGSGIAKTYLGILYITGDGVVRDVEKGIELLHGRAMCGDIEAQKYLGALYLKNEEDLFDIKKALEYLEMAAGRGDEESLYNVGKLYLEGRGCEKDTAGAVKCLMMANTAGYARAKVDLAICYLQGSGVSIDPQKAIVLLREYLNSKDENIISKRIAQRILGQAYASGVGIKKKDIQKSYTLIQSAADLGDIEAIAVLGVFYMGGNDIVIADFVKARKLFEHCLQNKHSSPNVVNSLANCLIFGKGGECDKFRAFQLLKSIEHLESTKTYEYLGLCFLNGWGTIKDAEQAIEYFRLAAKGGHFDAEIILAGLYLKGEHLTQNIAKAVQCFKKGHGFNNPFAQNALGMCYLKGYCGKSRAEDATTAFSLFKRAAEKSADALNNLGWCYLNGIGVAINPDEAVKCFQKSHSQGNLCALQNLAWCTLNGFGIKHDPEHAQKLFAEAGLNSNALNCRNKMGFSFLCYYGGNTQEELLQSIQLHHQNNPKVMHNFNLCLESGLGGMTEDTENLAVSDASNVSNASNVASATNIADVVNTSQISFVSQPSKASQHLPCFSPFIEGLKIIEALMDKEVRDLDTIIFGTSATEALLESRQSKTKSQEAVNNKLILNSTAAAKNLFRELIIPYQTLQRDTRKILHLNGRKVNTQSLPEILGEYRAKKKNIK